MSVAMSWSRKISCFGAVVFLLSVWSLWSSELHHIGSIAKQATSSSAAVNNTATVSRATLSDKAPLEELANVEEPRSIKAEHGDILQRPISSKPAAGPDLEVQRPTVPFKDALETHPHVLNRPLILYAYSESKNARKNLEFFLAHGIHAAADFVFILNGHTDVASSIPVADNIRYVQRPNDCYDLGAYAEVLTTDDLYRRYRKFIMLNASIRGPFLPYWAESCWSDMYLKRVTNEVKLVGMTANCRPSFHVQSMIWATDDVGISILLFPPEAAAKEVSSRPSYDPITGKSTMDFPQYPGINSCFQTPGAAAAAELGSSAVITAAGYKLDVLMTAYHGDSAYEAECSSKGIGDVLWDKAYFGTSVHPFETVFAKSDRDIDPVGLARLTDWTKGRGYNSYDFCPA